MSSPSRETAWDRFRAGPITYLTCSVFLYISENTPDPPSRKHTRVVCVSDTHNKTPPIPSGDILIHAGDLSNWGTPAELQTQIDWLDSLPHPNKFVISGNHDGWFDKGYRTKQKWDDQFLSWKSVNYIEDSEQEINIAFPDGMTRRKTLIYGSPWVPQCKVSNYAFQYPSSAAQTQWRHTVPAATDILVTHCPPRYFLDLPDVGAPRGCDGLLEEIWRTKPALHIFGHIHGSRGKMILRWDRAQKAYERACAKRFSGNPAGFLEILSARAWLELLAVVVLGSWGLAKSYLGWDRRERKTILVNAAVWYDQQGNLKAPIRVINM